MDRVNFFHGQVVLESEMDEVFDDAENAERYAAIEAGIAQALTTDSPDSSVFGGISTGLVVSGTPGDSDVSISIGTARDNQGRRINTETSSSVAISHTGSTDEGDDGSSSPAQGDGADITGSCSSGQYIVASLFIVYDENLSYSRTDATGTTISYRIEESFHFDIQISTAFSNPPVSTPGRAALSNNKVLVADLVITNNAGTMELVAICNSDQDWDDLGAYYENLAGRRADAVVLEQTNFDMLNEQNTEVRSRNARDAVYDLAAFMDSNVAWRNKTLGHSLRRRAIIDHFMYHEGNLIPADTTLRPRGLGPWGIRGVGGSTTHTVAGTDEPGGVILVSTDGLGNSGVAFVGGLYVAPTTYAESMREWFNIGAAPYAAMLVRFRIATITQCGAWFGFSKDANPGTTAGAWAAFNSAVDATELTAYVKGAAATGTGVKIGDISANTWHTLRIEVKDSTTCRFKLDTGSWVEASVSGGDAIQDDDYSPILEIDEIAGGQRFLELDECYVIPETLPTDMAI